MTIVVEHGYVPGTRNLLLEAMFEDRKRVFVDLLKWDVPVLGGRFELDEFDDEHATYIIIADEMGDHLGSARLLPTTRRHILDSLFACLCSGPVPTGPAVFEITRFCLSRRQDASSRRRIRNNLVSALAWHALELGIQSYTGVAEIAWLQQVLAFGWKCRPLGSPLLFECGRLGALAIDISYETPTLLARKGIWALPPKPLRIAKAA